MSSAPYGRIWSVLALLTVGAAGFLSLREGPGPHPASFAPLSTTGGPVGALRPAASVGLLPRATSPATRARLVKTYGKLPLTFIANRGQLDRRVAYYVPGRDKSLYFTAGGVTFALAGKTNDERRRTNDRRPTRQAGDGRPVVMPATFTVGRHPADRTEPSDRWALKLEFVGARPLVEPEGRDAAPTVVSYFKGPQSEWRTGIQTFASVAYSELWPGIDLVYAGSFERLKYTFEVKPGADPEQIRLAYHGASALALTPEGGLAVSTPAGGFTDDTPYAYQEIDGKRVPVEASYVLDEPNTQHPTPNTQHPTRGYHFRLGHYDHRRPLMLDPTVVMYGGFFGGNGDDIGFGIAVDSAGSVYVTGSTTSDTGFPVKAGPGNSFTGHDDGFVAKLNPAGTAVVYAGYFGGSGDDDPTAIAVDKDGNAYITGYTESTESSFPVKVGPGLKYKGGFYDAFVVKVNPTGTGLVYSGYIGGGGDDRGQGIAVDSAGNAYVTGLTSSSESSFPVKGGPSLKYGGGPYDAFVARVNAAGTGLDYAGYVGGSGDDEGYGIALDSDGNAYLTGSTTSDASSFPVKGGPGLTYNGAGGLGWGDAFVAKVKTDGSSLVYCGYLGGSSDDQGRGIAVDGAGSAYIAGSTTSATFPVKVGPQLTYQGGRDGFVAKVTPDGAGLVYSGYVGGAPAGNTAGTDDLRGIAVNSAGNAYVVGQSLSFTTSDTAQGGTLPAFRGPQLSRPAATPGGWYDVLMGEVRADGTGFVYLGMITISVASAAAGGGMQGWGIAVDGAGNAYVTGDSVETVSSDVFPPQPTGSSLSNVANHGGNDVLVSKIATQQLVTLSLPASAAPGSKVTGTVTLDVPAPPNGELITISSGNRAVATPDVDKVTIAAGKQTATFTITAAAAPPSQSTTITVYDDTYAAPAATLTVK